MGPNRRDAMSIPLQIAKDKAVICRRVTPNPSVQKTGQFTLTDLFVRHQTTAMEVHFDEGTSIPSIHFRVFTGAL